ncbi:MAG: 16S rRNA (guanine(527)-N(7))-methyltransferase RsmG [Planctomycetota bacterium]|jgi:16S rRNA (guanine527-N7)-methyltransferase
MSEDPWKDGRKKKGKVKSGSKKKAVKKKSTRKKWVEPEAHVLEFSEGSLTPSVDFLKAVETLGIGFDGGDVEMLGRYLYVLLETNQKFNLTAIKEEEAAWMRHVLDSLSLIPFMEGSKRVVDVGSGGGLPGIPLAITQPNVDFTLVDATGKKTRFLELVAQDLGLENVTVIQGRAEDVGRDEAHRERYDTSIARAIGPLNVLLEYTLPLIEVGGRLLAMKGARAEDELKECGDGLMMLGGGEVEVYEAMPGLDDEAVVVVVEKSYATPEEFPRRAGMAKQQPL